MWIETHASTTATFVFEHPLNDTSRLCLRLEALYKQLKSHLNLPTEEYARSALTSLLHILNIAERPDLKGKLTHTLSQYSTSLAQLEQFPNVDAQRLQSLLVQMDSLLHTLHNRTGRLGESLRQNDFLCPLRNQLAHPGGINEYSHPPLTLWLAQPSGQRTEQLKQWLSQLDPLYTTMQLLLNLIRQSSSYQRLITHDGFYHQTLDPTCPCEIIGLRLPQDSPYYPTMSVGRHRLTIHFLTPDYLDGSPQQANQTIEFELCLCRL